MPAVTRNIHLCSLILFGFLLLQSNSAYCDLLATNFTFINDKVEHLETEQEELHIGDIYNSGDWVSTHGKVSFGTNKREHWFRVDLSEDVDLSSPQVIEFTFSYTDSIDAYYFVNGEFSGRFRTGDSIRFGDRSIKNRKFIIPVVKEKNAKVELYFRSYTLAVTQIPMRLWVQDEFHKYNIIENTWYGLFLGSLGIMFFYHLFLYSVTRRTDVLAYVFLILVGMLFRLSVWGYGSQILWPDEPELNNFMVRFLNVFACLGIVTFCMEFIELRRRDSYHKKLVYAWCVFLAVSFFLIVFLPEFGSLWIGAFSLVGSLAVVFLISLHLWLQGDTVARFYFLSTVPFVLGILCIVLTFFGVLPVNFVTENISIVGLLIQMALQAFGIGLKIRNMQRDYSTRLKSLNVELEDKVEERTSELKESLVALKNTQKQLIETEKMAALTGLVAGVAHEINTPLGVSITAASSLKSKSEELKKQVDDGDLSRSGLNLFLEDTQEALKMVEKSLGRASDQVKSFKLLTVDLPTSKPTSINISEHIDGVVAMLKPQLEGSGHTVNVECDEQLTVNSFPNFLTQVLANLILNSVEHAFGPEQKGNMKIVAFMEKDTLVLDYLDDGVGLSSEELNNLFNPFYTSKRGSGHIGLGTTVTYNIVSHGLKGTITPSSPPGEGLHYLIKIPLS